MAQAAAKAISLAIPAAEGPLALATGVYSLVDGIRALSAAHEYSAKVDVVCAQARQKVILIGAGIARSHEITRTLDALASLAENVLGLAESVTDPASRRILDGKVRIVACSLKHMLDSTR